MEIDELIKMAKQSDYGACWFSEKGPIYISKEGLMSPAFTNALPSYKPEKDMNNGNRA